MKYILDCMYMGDYGVKNMYPLPINVINEVKWKLKGETRIDMGRHMEVS